MAKTQPLIPSLVAECAPPKFPFPFILAGIWLPDGHQRVFPETFSTRAAAEAYATRLNSSWHWVIVELPMEIQEQDGHAH